MPESNDGYFDHTFSYILYHVLYLVDKVLKIRETISENFCIDNDIYLATSKYDLKL
jgi:hypothetical protein